MLVLRASGLSPAEPDSGCRASDRGLAGCDESPARVCRPQGKIVVLGQVELLAENPDLVDERTPVHSQMTDIHDEQRSSGLHSGLKKRRVPFSFHAPPIFIAVENIGPGNSEAARASS